LGSQESAESKLSGAAGRAEALWWLGPKQNPIADLPMPWAPLFQACHTSPLLMALT